MDFVSHFLSGVAICALKPDNPDPKMNFLEKGLILIGSLMPDFPVTFIRQNIAKRIKKGDLGSMVARKLTKNDYETYASQASPWIEIYKTFHSLLFLILIASIETEVFGNLYATWGLLIHQVYDWPTHKFRSESINPKPLYPVLNWTWKWGIPCPWGFKWWFVLSWAIHLGIIAIILFIKHPYVT